MLLLTTLISVGTYAEKLEFTHTIAPTASQCFLENLGEAVNGKSEAQTKILAIIDIKSDARDLTFSVTDPKGKRLEE